MELLTKNATRLENVRLRQLHPYWNPKRSSEQGWEIDAAEAAADMRSNKVHIGLS